MKKFQERDPRAINLDATECCALGTGFAHNPETMSQLVNFVDKDKLKSYEDELTDSEHLALIPDDKIQTAYTQIVAAELRRLKGAKITFECVHSLEEHTKALQSVTARFSKPF